MKPGTVSDKTNDPELKKLFAAAELEVPFEYKGLWYMKGRPTKKNSEWWYGESGKEVTTAYWKSLAP